MAYTPDPNNTSEPIDGRPAGTAAAEFRALKAKIASIIAGAVVTTAAGANPADVQTFIQPSIEDRPAITAGGWLPWNLNQQWGGAPMPFHLIDAATGTEYKFDAFDAYIDTDTTTTSVGNGVGQAYSYQVITPAKNLSLQAAWVKVYKVLNPVDNLTLKLWSVAAGIPNALVATANVINGKQITSDTSGQWYRFSFAAVQALVAGTQYIITLEKSGGIDAANYYNWMLKATTKYPNNLAGTGTAAPVWTANNTFSRMFIAEAQASDQVIQSGGQFTGRIVGSEGNPINRSVAYCKPLREFLPLFHPNGWSILLRGKTWTKDRTICDLMYGPHHDRINIRSAIATGFTTVTIYKSDGTVNTITGTGDISGNTYKDILIVGRTVGDGGDYCRIYTGLAGAWIKEAEATAQTYTLDPLMLRQGTGWIMGGFQLFKNTDYTLLTEMGVLPSAGGWTFTTTTATVEGNVFAVSNGKLNQIKAGYAAGGDGYYAKAAAVFSNANGWMTACKLRVGINTNTKDEIGASVRIQDGTKNISLQIQEFYNSAQSTTLAYPQVDYKSADCTVLVSGKGSDAFQFVNGKLITDFTGAMLLGTATNQIDFGDRSVTAGENADVTWDNIGYYNTANVFPQFTSGELHEFVVFSGDKNTLAQAIYNGGVPISIKAYCGIEKNFVNDLIPHRVQQKGITVTTSTASAAFPPAVVSQEMEGFVIGSFVESRSCKGYSYNDTGGSSVNQVTAIDGVASSIDTTGGTSSAASTLCFSDPSRGIKTYFGLHKLELRFASSANIANIGGRSVIFEGRSA